MFLRASFVIFSGEELVFLSISLLYYWVILFGRGLFHDTRFRDFYYFLNIPNWNFTYGLDAFASFLLLNYLLPL